MTPRSPLAAVVLAAGAGTRLRPLTDLRPKALCPVGNVALVDLALARLAGLGIAGRDRVAVNAHHLADQLVGHLDGRVHLSVETPVAFGTAGALAVLRGWLAGRPVLVHNADAYLVGDPGPLLDRWSGERPRLLVTRDPERGDFGPWRHAGLSLLPAAEVARLAPRPGGLYELSWRPAAATGRLELVAYDGFFVDCGVPRDYLAANLHASSGRSVIGEGAVVDGEVERCVVWPGAVVHRGERLVECVRADGLTVDCAAPAARRSCSGTPYPP